MAMPGGVSIKDQGPYSWYCKLGTVLYCTVHWQDWH